MHKKKSFKKIYEKKSNFWALMDWKGTNWETVTGSVHALCCQAVSHILGVSLWPITQVWLHFLSGGCNNNDNLRHSWENASTFVVSHLLHHHCCGSILYVHFKQCTWHVIPRGDNHTTSVATHRYIPNERGRHQKVTTRQITPESQGQRHWSSQAVPKCRPYCSSLSLLNQNLGLACLFLFWWW